ncbi:hypothetical protein J6590_076217 [Homalodisca vitripennis]|nr:hypothetical protein J6590_076217 [Homalodisca vitripennis]
MTWLAYRVKIPMVVVVLVGDRKRGDAVTLNGVLPGPLLIGTACVLGAVWRSKSRLPLYPLHIWVH